jgi:adenylate cyclase, class 2
MREIEIKAIIRDEDSLRVALSNCGAVVTKKKAQVDKIYLPVGKSYENLTDVNILRIRKETGEKNSITFNLKKHISNELDCMEYETQITSPESMSDIILMLGYYEAISVSKVREGGTVQNYNFNIDAVEKLGIFLELEFLAEDADNVDVIAIQDQMSNFLASLGVGREDIVIFSYDTELYKRSIAAQ